PVHPLEPPAPGRSFDRPINGLRIVEVGVEQAPGPASRDAIVEQRDELVRVRAEERITGIELQRLIEEQLERLAGLAGIGTAVEVALDVRHQPQRELPPTRAAGWALRGGRRLAHRLTRSQRWPHTSGPARSQPSPPRRPCCPTWRRPD